MLEIIILEEAAQRHHYDIPFSSFFVDSI